MNNACSVGIAVIEATTKDTGITANDIVSQGKEKIMPSRVIEKIVRIEKQSLYELKKDNVEHIKFLRKSLEPEVAQEMIDSYFALRSEELEKLHDGEEINVKLIEIGSYSPLLWPYTSYTNGSFEKKQNFSFLFFRKIDADMMKKHWASLFMLSILSLIYMLPRIVILIAELVDEIASRSVRQNSPIFFKQIKRFNYIFFFSGLGFFLYFFH